MAHTVRLRKCGEHPNCQLESRDDGPFEHTPKDRTVEERFQKGFKKDRLEDDLGKGINETKRLTRLLADQRSQVTDVLSRIEHDAAGLPQLDELQRDLSRSITQSNELSSLLKEQHAKVDDLINRVQTGTEGLSQITALQAEAAKTGERLAKGQDDLQTIADRLGRIADAVTRDLDEINSRVHEIRGTESRINKTLGDAEELLSRISEQKDRIESLFGYFETHKAKLDRVEDLFSEVAELRDVVKAEVKAWQDKSIRHEADMKHEREERLQAHAKTQRQIQVLAERISGV